MKTSRAYQLSAIAILLFAVAAFTAVATQGDYDREDIRRQLDEMENQEHGTDLLIERTPATDRQPTPSSTASAATTEQGTAYDRIVTIVDRYGEYPVITDINNPNGKSPNPPFDVSVVLQASSCTSAKLHAFDLTRDLYTDPTVAPTIARVIIVTPGYVTTSLGARGAQQVTGGTWEGVGSSYFVDSLKKVRNRFVDESEGLATADLTFAVEESGCH